MTASSPSPFLVSTDWLFSKLDEPNISIVDGSWYLPTMNRDARAEYDAQHIPGAVFFDLDAIANTETGLPHTLAAPEVFAREVGRLGIAHDDTIVVYDGMGLFSAPRVWWNFRVMGATKAVILDGGLPKWLEDRLPIEAGNGPIYPKLFAPDPSPQDVVPFEEMHDLVQSGAAVIADARPFARFTGESPEPRDKVRSGHMPGATSVPFDSVQQDGRLLPPDRLRAVLAERGIDGSRPVITTCGSGVTAAVLSLALETVGYRGRLYDGSWSEWGSRTDTPVLTGR